MYQGNFWSYGPKWIVVKRGYFCQLNANWVYRVWRGWHYVLVCGGYRNKSQRDVNVQICVQKERITNAVQSVRVKKSKRKKGKCKLLRFTIMLLISAFIVWAPVEAFCKKKRRLQRNIKVFQGEREVKFQKKLRWN